MNDDTLREIILSCDLDTIVSLHFVSKKIYNLCILLPLQQLYFPDLKLPFIKCYQINKICQESAKELKLDIKTIYNTKDIGNDVKRGIKLGNLHHHIGILANLVKINFSYSNCTIIPRSIGKLVNLTRLELQNNQIKVIPKELGDCINLKYLNLSNNNITFLPNRMINLVNLSDLTIHHNCLLSFPKGFDQLIKLEYLDCSNNEFRVFPNEVVNLINDNRMKNVLFVENKISAVPLNINNPNVYIGLQRNLFKSVPQALRELNIQS